MFQISVKVEPGSPVHETTVNTVLQGLSSGHITHPHYPEMQQDVKKEERESGEPVDSYSCHVLFSLEDEANNGEEFPDDAKQNIVKPENTEICTLNREENPGESSDGNELFSHSGTVEKHENTHARERFYQCNYCDKKFTQAGSLKSHERTHKGEKSYQCSYCKKMLANKNLYEGLPGFYKGMVPNLLRVTPACCITFLVYEKLSHYLLPAR
ncbi:uncharacterized protein [Apostichopus japonicus]|uniref:uncharacterized protein n=1 Tax=Stichopus japonicus TaxID=307972 RepID=UPI003AB5EE82